MCETKCESMQLHKPFVVCEHEKIYQEDGGAHFALWRDSVKDMRTHRQFHLHYAEVTDGRSGAVCIVERGGRLLLAQHWRESVGEWLWEFPRGMGVLGETAEQTALRELAEETGLHAHESQVEILQYMHADAGVIRDSVAIASIRLNGEDTETGVSSVTGCGFEAESIVALDSDEMHGEALAASDTTDSSTIMPALSAKDNELENIQWKTEHEIDMMIAHGTIQDGITLAAYMIWKSRR